MAFGHEKLDVYRIVAILTKVGQRGYAIREQPIEDGMRGINPDPDHDTPTPMDAGTGRSQPVGVK